MAKNTTRTREPLFHVAKRGQMPLWKSLAIRICAILAALLFCGVLCIVVLGKNPISFYDNMFKGVFGTKRRIWKMLKDLAVLLCVSLAVTPAFKMRYWNIGAEGQVHMSCLASVACAFYLGGSVPNNLLLVIMLLAAITAGAIWAVIPAIFKAIWNTNETLFTLMMNYIATSLVAFFLVVWVPSGSSALGELSAGWLPTIGGAIDKYGYLLLVLIVALLTVAMFIYLKYSKHGYEISVVGESRKTACYIGINVKKVIIRTLIVSGVLCGIAGFLIVSALDHSITVDTVGGRGFTAIMVSWLGKFNPFVMILTSFLMVFLQQGSDQVVSAFRINDTFTSIVTGIILFFIIGCEFFINYKLIFHKKEGKK
ncbi:MAG: ABC transporter permease [Ruminococcaceae bacterium]|nr:ABC transporter permease [Oscillospiraceae bacterium]